MGSRNYVFTVNNWDDEDERGLANLPAPLKYVCWGREVGEEGTPHLQGYLELNKPCRFSALKKLGKPFDRMHMEVRHGTQLEAINYTRKECGEENWFEYGKKSTQGSRTDLDRARVLALTDGMRGVTLVCNSMSIRVAEKFLTYHEPERDWAPEVYWIWGPTGTGKSRLAREMLEDMDVYTKNTGNKWWNGYDGHDGLIIDDFRDSWWPLTEMLAILDRYGFRVECKGGERQLRAKKIVVTSAFPPEETYRGAKEALEQLTRRITKVIHLCDDVTKSGGNTVPQTSVEATAEDIAAVYEEFETLFDLRCQTPSGTQDI